MRRAERIEFALGPPGEAGQTAALAQRAHAVAAAGQYLVRVGLMADIPDDLVGRRIEHVVQRDGEFDDTEPRTQMAAGNRHDIDGFLPQLIGEAAQIFSWNSPQIPRFPDLVEKRRFGHYA